MAHLNPLTLTDKDGDELTIEGPIGSAEGVAFVTASKSGVYLTARQVRQLIDRLEPLAAPPASALDTFNEFPLGQVFEWGSHTTKRVKVSTTHYAVIADRGGRVSLYEASHTLSGHTPDAVKAVS